MDDRDIRRGLEMGGPGSRCTILNGNLMDTFHFVFARPGRCAIALLALLVGACGSDGAPQMPIDDFTGATPIKDAGSRSKRDAGNAENADEPAAESTDDREPGEDDGSEREPVEDGEDDVSASAGQVADAGKLGAKDAGAGRDAGPAPSETESCETLTYASFGKTFVETYCTECHNSKTPTMGLGGVVLDTLPMIVKNKMYLKKDVAPRADGKLPKMPKGGNDQLTDAERTKFGAWIDCGPT